MESPPILAPFRGLRYSAAKIRNLAEVMAPPYDVISPARQAELYERNPFNLVRLILPQQQPDDKPGHNRYTRAAADLQNWVRDGTLVRDSRSTLYLYEQDFSLPGEGARRFQRRGFIALRLLEEFGANVRPHEQTLSGPKMDRLSLITNCHAHLSPVFALYSDRSGEVLKSLTTFFTETSPDLDLVDNEEIRHRLWRVEEREAIRSVSEQMAKKTIFIADGHHRYETAIAYRNQMRQQYPNAVTNAPFNYVMIYFNEISDPGLVILPTHRVVTSKGKAFDEGELLGRLRGSFRVESFRSEHRDQFFRALADLQGDRRGFGITLSRGEKFHLIAADKGETRLDVLLVHEEFFQNFLGLGKEEQRERVRYVQPLRQVLKILEKESGSIAVFLNPPVAEDLISVMGQGRILPPKTTYFYPKLLSGLVLHPIDPTERVTI